MAGKGFMATIIHCPTQLKAKWPKPLAEEWRDRYPHLFDEEDLRLALSQPRYHFNEWFAAVHLFHRDGVYVLVEKYFCANHSRKQKELHDLVGAETRDLLSTMLKDKNVQPPDLLWFTSTKKDYGFAEVKGPKDSLKESQVRSHEEIRERLGKQVEIIEVVIC